MVLCCMVKLSQSSSWRASMLRPQRREHLLACKASCADAASPPAPLQLTNTQRPLSPPNITSIPVIYDNTHINQCFHPCLSLAITNNKVSLPLSSYQHLQFLPQSWSCSMWFFLVTDSWPPGLTTLPHTTGYTPNKQKHLYTSHTIPHQWFMAEG